MATAGLVLALGTILPPVTRAQEPPTGSVRDTVPDTPEGGRSSQAVVALDARLSPDGRSIAYRELDDGVPRLFVRAVGDSLGAARPLTSAAVPVGAYAWAPDSRHVVLSDPAGRRLDLVVLDAPAGRALPGAQPSELINGVDGRLRVVGFAPDAPSVLVEVPGRWPEAPDLVRVDLATGKRAVAVRNEGGVRRWMVDDAGRVRLGIRRDDGGGTELARWRDGELVPIYRCAVDRVCEPVGFHPDGRIWIRSDRGRETPALLLLDPLTFEEEVVRADVSDDPQAAFRGESAFADATSRVRAVVGEDATLTFHEPRAEAARLLVTARTAVGGELLLLDRWSGAVDRLLPLGDSPPLAPVAPRPHPDLLVPARLGYRITDHDSSVPPTEMERRIESATENGAPVWRVVDVAEVPTYEMPGVDADVMAGDPDAVEDAFADDPDHDPFEALGTVTGRARATDTTVLDGATLEPLRRRAEGPVGLELDFAAGAVTGVAETQGFESRVHVTVDGRAWSDGSALEMLVAASPLSAGYRSRVTLLDTQTLELTTVTLEVRGAQEVTTQAGTFDVWLLVVTSEADADREETWLVWRSAPHYVIRSELRTGDLVRITELTDPGWLR